MGGAVSINFRRKTGPHFVGTPTRGGCGDEITHIPVMAPSDCKPHPDVYTRRRVAQSLVAIAHTSTPRYCLWMKHILPPLLLSWVYPAAARVGWLTTTVTNPCLRDAQGLVYLFRGNGTVFTPGFGRLTDRLRIQGLWAEDLTCNGLPWARQHLMKEDGSRPLILIGHSCGGRRCLQLAALLEAAGISLDLLICIDVAFTPTVPTNVRRAVHLYRSRWRIYPARPLVPCPGGTSQIDNIDLDQPHPPFPGTWLHHLNITGSDALQLWIKREVTQLVQARVPPLAV